MESNGERIAEIQVHPRGQNIRIKKIWKATTLGAEPREDSRLARFVSPEGDMWFLIDLDIDYDHHWNIVGIQEHWKIVRHGKYYRDDEEDDDSDEGINDQPKRNQGSKGDDVREGGTRPGGWSSKGERKGGIRCPCICCRLKGAPCICCRLKGGDRKGCKKGEGERKG